MKLLIAFAIAAAGCYSNAGATQKQASTQTRKTDVETQRDVFFRCLETIPTGGSHTSIGNEDWSKVIAECHKVSVNLSVVAEPAKPTVTNTTDTVDTTPTAAPAPADEKRDE